MDSIKIRDMSPEDANTVYRLGVNTEEYEVAESEEIFWSIEQLKKWSKKEDDVNLVAQSDGEIVGYILSHIHNPTGKVEIENLYVDPNWRRNGIGKKLMDSLIDSYDNAEFFVGLVLKTNDSMHKFMNRCDFDRGEDVIWWQKL